MPLWKIILSLCLLSFFSLFANVEIKSDEGLMEKERSLFTGNVSLSWPHKLKIFCDQVEYQRMVGYHLKALQRSHLLLELADPEITIRSKRASIDQHFEKALFSEDVNVIFGNYHLMGPGSECELDQFIPQHFSLFSSKKEGCSLKCHFLKNLTFQRVNFDVVEKNAIFFFPKGEFTWREEPVTFTSNWLKLEDGDVSRLVLDGKVVIKIGKAVFLTNGPLVIHFNPETLQVEKLTADGKSHFAWEDESLYSMALDGFIQYESATNLIHLRTPLKDGILLKYPFGEVRAGSAEIAIIPDEEKPEVDQVKMLGGVFATYGIPTHGVPMLPLQYLMADHLTIKPMTHLASLFSGLEKRVLLYDQVNKLEMSADQVNIHWGDKMGDERIQGIGDVRFSFDQKERGIIDALFKSR